MSLASPGNANTETRQLSTITFVCMTHAYTEIAQPLHVSIVLSSVHDYMLYLPPGSYTCHSRYSTLFMALLNSLHMHKTVKSKTIGQVLSKTFSQVTSLVWPYLFKSSCSVYNRRVSLFMSFNPLSSTDIKFFQFMLLLIKVAIQVPLLSGEAVTLRFSLKQHDIVPL